MNSAELQEGKVPSRYLIKQPRALQYFHNGQLKKLTEGERAAGRFELFLDLLYVALVSNFAEDLASHPSGAELVKYLLIFVPAWHIWADLREIMNAYYTDDLLQRLIILWIMALLVLYGNNATLVVQDIGAMRTTVGAFIAARFTVMLVYIIASFASFQHRPQSRLMACCIFVTVLIYTPLFFSSVSIRAKIAVVVVGIAFTEIGLLIIVGPWIKKRLKLEFSTAVDINHEIDRCAAFFIIILGEYLYTIVAGNPAAIGFNKALLKAVWTLIIAFCLNWIYTIGDGSIDFTHPIRHSVPTAFAYFTLHIPLSASLLVGGHVCAASTAIDELDTGERWLMGGGLGIGMVCLWGLAMIHKSKDSGNLILPKGIRVSMRLVVGIILALLPLTTAEQLDTVRLLSVIMALFAFVVIWETIGGLMKGAKVWEKWEGRNRPVEDPVDGEKLEVQL